jgi:hypothetical protein
MGILKKIRGALFGSPGGEIRDPAGIFLYVKCARCGAPVRVRADKYHDLQRDYDTGEFVLNKEIMDGSCFALMQATIRYDAGYRVIEQGITGGEFITWDQYVVLTTPAEEPDDA